MQISVAEILPDLIAFCNIIISLCGYNHAFYLAILWYEREGVIHHPYLSNQIQI